MTNTERRGAASLFTAAGMPPRLAHQLVARYTRPGGLVLDPDCRAGSVLVAAVSSGRHAVGLASNPMWWELARASLNQTKHAGALPDGMVLDGRLDPPLRWAADLAALRGRVDLIATACRARRGPRGVPRLVAMLPWLTRLLRPDGHLVLATCQAPKRAPGPSELAVLIAAAQRGGLALVARRLVLLPADAERPAGRHDVLVFRPMPLAVAEALPDPERTPFLPRGPAARAA